MIAAQFTNLDLLMVVGIVLLLVVLIFLSVAEMGLSRMTRPRAGSLAEKGLRSGKALKRLVDEPERWVNPLLLTVNVCQIVQATLTSIVAGRLFGPLGVVIGVVLNVIVFFVLAEAVPKTYAVQYPQKAALLAARPVAALVAFPPLRWISKWLILLTNVIVRGKGLEQGPFVNEQELLGIVEVAAEDMVIEEEERELTMISATPWRARSWCRDPTSSCSRSMHRSRWRSTWRSSTVTAVCRCSIPTATTTCWGSRTRRTSCRPSDEGRAISRCGAWCDRSPSCRRTSR